MSSTRSMIVVLLVAVMAAGGVGLPKSASALLAEPCTPSTQADVQGSDILIDLLVERGVAQDQAESVVASLNVDDINVLVQNPEMLQGAGDEGTNFLAIIGGVFLVLIIIAALAA